MFPMGEEGTLLNPDFKRHCEIVNAQQPFLEESAIIFLNVNLKNVLKTKPNNIKQLRLSIYKTQH
jgi:hypothetical protein